MRRTKEYAALAAAVGAAFVIPATSSTAVEDHSSHDIAVVAALDTQYQAAVKRNDAATMDRILADDFVLVTGKGAVVTKQDLLRDARAKTCVYEHQEEVAGTQTVRQYGPSTAIVTAQLWEKGTCADGTSFDSHLWFSDTYVKSYGHWRYVFGQASRAL
ncbi:nuclear transport factor 2 family protein [Actinocrispum wychmicini]|uniref:Uncharacterized protein DUF4440 n=1 Tax=Actinocrispum wychmicini TaxID=1213861 RepID=A0A4V2S7L7_9PSEU|nr:nuclear transport factor 2 family protein [Actinocrispum wychmicini]TCO60550.1 uncharacterized protein DUF4440 [Actinocrispum wychmicini]